jgi:hypothetical protein
MKARRPPGFDEALLTLEVIPALKEAGILAGATALHIPPGSESNEFDATQPLPPGLDGVGDDVNQIANRRRLWWWSTLAFAAFVGICLLVMFPPVQGFYHARAFEVLDGSSGYLHLHNGVVDVVNMGGQHGDSRKRIGTYQGDARRLTISIDWPQPEVRSVHVSALKLRWRQELVHGLPELNDCPREILPWVLRRLRSVERPATESER